MDYKLLKDLIKASLAELEGDDNARHSFSPRTTSLTVQRANRGRRNSEEEFFEVLEQQVSITNKTYFYSQPLYPDLKNSSNFNLQALFFAIDGDKPRKLGLCINP